MSSTEFLLRVMVAFAALILLVVMWALIPYLQGAHLPNGEFDAPMLSLIFGTTKPNPIPIGFFLLSRGLLGMAVVSWIFVPSFRFLVDADFRPLARAAVILFFGCSFAMFLSGVLFHLIFNA